MSLRGKLTKRNIIGVMAVLGVGGVVLGTPLFGIKLAAVAGLASMGPAGPDLAGVFANVVGMNPFSADAAALLGEYTPALADAHQLLPYGIAGGLIGLLLEKGRQVRSS